jgi:surfeit locus 1 family protein
MSVNLYFTLGQRKYLLRSETGFLLLCLFFVGLLSMLGVWQLHRYQTKQALLTHYSERSVKVAKPFNEVVKKAADLQYQRVAISGNYVNNLTMLVQNKFYNGQPGYEVLTPVRIPGDDKLLLVDRGWVRQLLAKRTRIKERQQFTGDLKVINEYQFILGKNIPQPDATPLVMQKIDIAEISRVTNAVYYPFVLRLDNAADTDFVRDWPSTIETLNPQRNLGYAVQWFLMALVLVIAFLSFCLERVEPTENANPQ